MKSNTKKSVQNNLKNVKEELQQNSAGANNNLLKFSEIADAYSFLMAAGGKNKSAFINQLLKQEQQRILRQEILKANQEEAKDADYQAELSDWEATLEDGIHNDH